jgi:hypothetical protein
VCPARTGQAGERGAGGDPGRDRRAARIEGTPWRQTAKLIVFELVQTAARRWRRLTGAIRLPSVIECVSVNDSIALDKTET